MTPRIVETGTTLSSWIGPLAKVLVPPIALGAAAGGFFSAAITSSRTMRPPGPEPLIRDTSMPFS